MLSLATAFLATGSAGDIQEADRHWWVAIIILLGLLLAFVVPLGCRYICSVSLDNSLRPTSRGLAKVAQIARYRVAARQSHRNEVPQVIPPSGRYIGESKEKDDLCFLDYELRFEANGVVKGMVRGQQKTYVVDGFFHAEKGKYLWGETDNSFYSDAPNEPHALEKALITKRAYHCEAEVAIKNALTGRLFVSFTTSTGIEGHFHCKFSPVGQLPSEDEP